MSAPIQAGPLARRLRHLPGPLAVSGVLLVVGVATGWAVDGSAGALGAAVGVTVVVASYVLSSVAIAWADSIAPKLVLTVGLATYLFKFTALGAAFLAVPRADWAGTRAMAVAMIVMVLAWLAAQVWWTVRARIPYVDVSA